MDTRFSQYRTPRVYVEQRFSAPHDQHFGTGVPVFLGQPDQPASGKPQKLSMWAQYGFHFGRPQAGNYLAAAVRGFFKNGGEQCYVVALKSNSLEDLEDALTSIASLNMVDLVCAPDATRQADMAFVLQQAIVQHCDRMGNRFAILDSVPGSLTEDVIGQWRFLSGMNGALYYPWIQVRNFDGQPTIMPPCGHIAGTYARADKNWGVHKAPANTLLEEVFALEQPVPDAVQNQLNPVGVNCLRSFPGRGIRVWGARTISGDSAWTYINVRRLFLTAARWFEWHISTMTFEPNNPELWRRIERELRTYFNEQYKRGALKGNTPEEAFYVACNKDTNAYGTSADQVVVEVGLAPAIPSEFVVVRLIHSSERSFITGPQRPAEFY